MGIVTPIVSVGLNSPAELESGDSPGPIKLRETVFNQQKPGHPK